MFLSFRGGGGEKKKLLSTIEGGPPYTEKIALELAWEDPTLVIIDEWSSYRGGHLSRFDCISYGFITSYSM